MLGNCRLFNQTSHVKQFTVAQYGVGPAKKQTPKIISIYTVKSFLYMYEKIKGGHASTFFLVKMHKLSSSTLGLVHFTLFQLSNSTKHLLLTFEVSQKKNTISITVSSEYLFHLVLSYVSFCQVLTYLQSQ